MSTKSNSRVRNALRMKKAEKRRARENRCKRNKVEGSYNSNLMTRMLNADSDHSGDAMYIHSIGRSVVEAQDITALQADVHSLFLSSRDRAMRVKGKVTFIFEGWENDKRELCEIPEVRSYVSKMMRAFPVFFLCDNLTILLAHNCSCFVKVISQSGGMSAIEVNHHSDSFREFADNGFGLMNEYYERYGLSDEMNIERSKELFELFQGKRRWDEAA